MFASEELINEMDRLKKFAFRLTKNASDADDLLQNTLLRAYEKKHLFKEGTNLYSWVSTMMFNLFATQLRRKTKFETQYDPESFIEKESVEATQDVKMELQDVTNAMGTLSHAHQKILFLVCVQGMSYEAVSNNLNIPVGTVRSRLSRARDALQIALNAPSYGIPAQHIASLAANSSNRAAA